MFTQVSSRESYSLSWTLTNSPSLLSSDSSCTRAQPAHLWRCRQNRELSEGNNNDSKFRKVINNERTGFALVYVQVFLIIFFKSIKNLQKSRRMVCTKRLLEKPSSLSFVTFQSESTLMTLALWISLALFCKVTLCHLRKGVCKDSSM